MRNCWLVRAGEGSRHAVGFATGSAIAIGWNDIPGLEDLRSMEQSEMTKLLRAAGRSAGVASADAQEMIDFRDTIQIGDVAVTPDAPAREILVGEVTGEYEFRSDAPLGDYNHVRTVDWYGRYGRDQLSAVLQQDTRFRRTIRRLETHGDEWSTLAGEMKSGDVVPATARRGSVRRPDPPEVSTRRCSACGYQKVTSQFVGDGELCVDCR